MRWHYVPCSQMPSYHGHFAPQLEKWEHVVVMVGDDKRIAYRLVHLGVEMHEALKAWSVD